MKEKKKLGEMLIDAGFLSREKLDLALNVQKRTHERLGQIIERLGFITDEELAQTIAKQYGMAMVVPIYEREIAGVYYNTAAVIDADGTPKTTNFADYPVISAAELPSFELVPMETPTWVNELGAKGVGELPSIPTSAAITNAICRATGVRVRSLPVDQDELLRACKAGADTVELGWGDLEPVPHAALGSDL